MYVYGCIYMYIYIYVYRDMHRHSQTHAQRKTTIYRQGCVVMIYVCPLKYFVLSLLRIFRRLVWNPLTWMDCSCSIPVTSKPAKAILPPDISDWELWFYFWSWGALCKVAGLRLKQLVVRFIFWAVRAVDDVENWGYSKSLILCVSLDNYIKHGLRKFSDT